MDGAWNGLHTLPKLPNRRSAVWLSPHRKPSTSWRPLPDPGEARLMQFVIANTFQESLTKLQGSEQNAAKLAAMELQMNPSHPSLKMHRLEKVKDKNFWSARAN